MPRRPRSTLPSDAKNATNYTRNRPVTCTLRALGWTVLRIWQHELKRRNTARLLCRLRAAGLVL